MKSTTIAGALAGLVALTATSTAWATPVTVDLRVEGPTRTLVEQKVTVDIRRFKFSDSTTTYQCDGTGSSGTTTTPSPTRNGALAEAAERGGFELLGSFGTLGASYTRINGEGVGYDAATMRYLAEYKNGKPSDFGGCAETITAGDDVLFAFGTGSEPPLRLAGPATVRPGERATLTVTSQADGQGVAGAAVAGQSTAADGRATTVPLTQRGPQSFKATKSGAIRSNAVSVCVTDGADGFCNTTKPGDPPAPSLPGPLPSTPGPGPGAGPAAGGPPDRQAASGRIGSITDGRRFGRGRGPRTLAGTVDPEAAGLKDVRVRLARTSGRRCSYYSGTRERFVAARRCGVKNARTFSVGANATFSYLLPAVLPSGRYVLDVVVLDRAGNRTKAYLRGRNRVVFYVR